MRRAMADPLIPLSLAIRRKREFIFHLTFFRGISRRSRSAPRSVLTGIQISHATPLHSQTLKTI